MKINSGEIIIILSIILVCYFLINLCNKSFEGFDGLPTCQRLTESCNDVTSVENLSYSCCNAIIHNENRKNPNEYCDEVKRFPIYEKFVEICPSALQTLSPCDYENTNSIKYEKKSLGMRDPIEFKLDSKTDDYGEFLSCNCNSIATGDTCSRCNAAEMIKNMTFQEFINFPPDNPCLKEIYITDVTHDSITYLSLAWIRININEILDKTAYFVKKNKIDVKTTNILDWIENNKSATAGIYVLGTFLTGVIFQFVYITYSAVSAGAAVGAAEAGGSGLVTLGASYAMEGSIYSVPELISAGFAVTRGLPLVAGRAALVGAEFAVWVLATFVAVVTASIVTEASDNILISVAMGQCKNRDLCHCVTDFTSGDMTVKLKGSKPKYADLYFNRPLKKGEKVADCPISFRIRDQTIRTEPGHGLLKSDIDEKTGNFEFTYDLGTNVPMAISGNPIEGWYCS